MSNFIDLNSHIIVLDRQEIEGTLQTVALTGILPKDRKDYSEYWLNKNVNEPDVDNLDDMLKQLLQQKIRKSS